MKLPSFLTPAKRSAEIEPVGVTRVAFLLDASGSMELAKDSTIKAFNTYVSTLKKGGQNLIFSFLQFESTLGMNVIYKNRPIADVRPITHADYITAGGTPLIDACVTTIRGMEEAVQPGDKVVICFQTDGEENSSTMFGWGYLKNLIKEKQALGWQFNFMGVGLEAYSQSSMMGLGRAQTMSYDIGNEAATRASFTANAANTVSYASGARSGTQYSAAQKMAAGDKFDPSLKGILRGPTAALPDLTDEDA